MTESIMKCTNDGPKLLSSNFWQSSLNARGGACCSINARCFRILLPDVLAGVGPAERVIDEMMTAKVALITRGRIDNMPAFDFNFDDGTDTPFYLLLGARQFVTLPAREDDGRTDLTCDIYQAGAEGPLMALHLPARYRHTNDPLPSMRPWTKEDK